MPLNPARFPSAEQWTRIEDVFHQARNQHGSARAEVLQHLCAGDGELLADVRALLRADEEANRPRQPKKARTADLVGRRAGNYQLDSSLGAGGMGSVYLAHRCDGQFDRQVALKILGANLRSEFFTERFALERQLLASLDHPNITRLLDSGVSGEGDPYLVLEYVDGKPVDQYCDEWQLPVEDRLRLFRQICAAVEFAHGRRVVHRDLKPSNILVTSDGKVKLLDFGTAKLLGDTGADITATRFRMMTPRYASPEQLRGDALTSATDVCSLGIVLYELLTGAWPYGDPQSVVSGLERAVRDVEPRHPQGLQRDLWKVISKALQAEPERRYPSVKEFAADLERYLNGSPVLARPQTLAYRTGKLVRRNRGTVAFALAGIALAAGLYFGRTRPAPAKAAASIAVLPFQNFSADAANRYFSDGLTAEITDALSHLKPLRVIARDSAFQFRDKAGDIRAVGRQLNVTNVLEGTVERYGNRVRIVARLERTSDGSQIWSSTYERQISDLFSVQSELAAGIAASLRASVGVPGPARHIVRDEEARDAYMRGIYEAEQFTPEALSQAAADLKHAIDRDPQYAAAYAALGAVTNNQNVVAPKNHASAAEVVRAVSPYYRKALDLDPDLVTPRVNLAEFALQFDWDWGRAEQEYRTALAMGANATAHQSYGSLLVFQGRFAEADEHLRLAQELNPYSTAQIRRTAAARNLEGRFAQARDLAQGLLTRFPNMLSARFMVDSTYIAEGRPELALADCRKIETQGPTVKLFEALALAREGRREEALRLLRPFEERYQEGTFGLSAFAQVYAFVGDEASSLKWLEMSADRREWATLDIAVNPVYARMRGAAGFQALMKRVGLVH